MPLTTRPSPRSLYDRSGGRRFGAEALGNVKGTSQHLDPAATRVVEENHGEIRPYPILLQSYKSEGASSVVMIVATHTSPYSHLHSPAPPW